MVSTKRFSVLLLVVILIGVLSLPAQAQDATAEATTSVTTTGATIPAAKCDQPGAVTVRTWEENWAKTIKAAPMEWVTAAIYYNKDLFDKAGLAYPTAAWTWDDFAKDAAALTDKANGVYGAAVYAEYQAGWGGWVASEGVPPLVTQDRTT